MSCRQDASFHLNITFCKFGLVPYFDSEIKSNKIPSNVGECSYFQILNQPSQVSFNKN